jgi:hypothetical protein
MFTISRAMHLASKALVTISEIQIPKPPPWSLGWHTSDHHPNEILFYPYLLSKQI